MHRLQAARRSIEVDRRDQCARRYGCGMETFCYFEIKAKIQPDADLDFTATRGACFQCLRLESLVGPYFHVLFKL